MIDEEDTHQGSTFRSLVFALMLISHSSESSEDRPQEQNPHNKAEGTL